MIVSRLYLCLSLAATMALSISAIAQDDSSMSSSIIERSSSSTSSSNSSSSADSVGFRTEESAGNPADASLRQPADTGIFKVSGEKASIMFVPKFRQRLNDLAEQIHLAQNKNFINADEAARFIDRQAKLLATESDLSKKGYPRPELDSLEKSITSLNGDLFAAMHKSDPVKPGPSEKEVNDPNLIPAYPDKDLQPK